MLPLSNPRLASHDIRENAQPFHSGRVKATGKPLAVDIQDHALKGGYAGCRERHLKPDLLLIYVQSTDELRLIRLGSHSELIA